MFKTTLEQWFVFKTIVEQNGFNAAAEVLNRSQSTISYSMAKLQSQLNVQLIVMKGKNFELTPAGRRLLQNVSPLLNDFDHLEKTANVLAAGVEARIAVSVDALFPKDILFNAISSCCEKFPFTEVNVAEHIRLKQSDSYNYDLAIGISEDGVIPGAKLLEVKLIPVAVKNHPLFRVDTRFYSREYLSGFKKIVYQRSFNAESDSSPLTSCNTWSVTSIDSAVAAVKSGLCYGWLPQHIADEMLKTDVIIEIPIENAPQRDIPLYLIERQNKIKGPALTCLTERIIRLCITEHEMNQVQNAITY